MSYLLVTSVTPEAGSGRGMRVLGVVAALARHAPVEVAYVRFGRSEPDERHLGLDRVRYRRIDASRGMRRWVLYARVRGNGVPSDLARGVSPELAGAAGAAGDDVRVIADGPVAAAALHGLARRRELIYLAHNLEHAFRTDFGRGDIRRFEQTVLRTFAESWMCTRADVAGARALAAGAHGTVRYVPNVVDTGSITPVRPAGTRRILFVADLRYAPNREGLEFLTGTVMPQVWERAPDLRLTVVGRGLPAPPADRRVEALGFVEDLDAVYARSDAVAVPLLHGGGSPLKFVEALAQGLPVVATHHAAGLLEDAVAGEEFLSAADGASFAEALLRAVCDRDAAIALGEAGRRRAETSYSVDTLARLLAPPG